MSPKGTSYNYVVIIGEVLEYESGTVRIRLEGTDGEPMYVWIGDTYATPLTDEQAQALGQQYDMKVPQ